MAPTYRFGSDTNQRIFTDLLDDLGFDYDEDHANGSVTVLDPQVDLEVEAEAIMLSAERLAKNLGAEED